MAIRLQETEPDDYIFAMTPTGRELPPVIDHWKRLEDRLKSSLVKVPAPTIVELIVKFRALPNWRMRWCTRLTKIEPFMDYVKGIAPAKTYIGIRADEVSGENAREGTDWNGIPGVIQDFPLVRWGWGISRVQSYLAEKGVEIPKRTDCDFCFFQRLIEWYEFWRDWPEQWKEAEALEKFTGFTFRSAERDTWPASMEGLRKCFEEGKVPIETRNRERKTMCSWCAR
jgi:3'-phosphoadenosine 5'-phosphosulfate sulfotransferase (PAPS reductase)/FAD synthetase